MQFPDISSKIIGTVSLRRDILDKTPQNRIEDNEIQGENDLSVLQQVQKTMKEFHMIEAGDKIVTGVSGGADSVCLLTVLRELAEQMEIQLHVVHVNHLLRKEAEEEEAYVRELCDHYGITCTVFHKDIEAYAGELKCSVEEAGRIYRYQCFEQVRVQAGAQKIAVAHHQNDRAETVLFHMLRGTGMRGLGSIPPVRGVIIRPLLQVSRKEIEVYLEEKRIDYYMDASNASDAYSRNVIRNQVLPLLEGLNEQAVSHITAISELAREYWDYVEQQAMKLEQECVAVRESRWMLKEEAFCRYPRVVRQHLAFRILSQAAGAAKDLEQDHVAQLLGLLDKPVGKQVSLPYGMIGVRTYSGLEVRAKDYRTETAKTRMAPLEVIVPGRTIIEGVGSLDCKIVSGCRNQEISKKLYTKMLDYGKINTVLCIRNPMHGDYFIMNRQGERKKLSRFFIDNKIPQEQRESILVLAAGSRVCWIIGMRISEDVKVTEATEQVLQIRFQYEGEENE